MNPIQQAAATIASVLGGIPGIKQAFPYPKPLSQCQPGDLVMAIAAVSPPGQSGVNVQTIVWDVVVMLRGTPSGRVEEWHNTISDLCSLDTTKGILGVLYNNDAQVAAMRTAGVDPYLDPDADGINIDYNVEVADKVMTLLRFQVQAELEAE